MYIRAFPSAKGCTGTCNTTRFVSECTTKTYQDVVSSIDKTVKMRKLKWFGHIKRPSYPIKQVFEGLINGNRGRGRPQRRLRDDIKDRLPKGLEYDKHCV